MANRWGSRAAAPNGGRQGSGFKQKPASTKWGGRAEVLKRRGTARLEASGSLNGEHGGEIRSEGVVVLNERQQGVVEREPRGRGGLTGFWGSEGDRRWGLEGTKRAKNGVRGRGGIDAGAAEGPNCEVCRGIEGFLPRRTFTGVGCLPGGP